MICDVTNIIPTEILPVLLVGFHGLRMTSDHTDHMNDVYDQNGDDDDDDDDGDDYDDDDDDDDDDLYVASTIMIIISLLLLYYNDDEMISSLLDLGIRIPKKQKSSEFNSIHDGIII